MWRDTVQILRVIEPEGDFNTYDIGCHSSLEVSKTNGHTQCDTALVSPFDIACNPRPRDFIHFQVKIMDVRQGLTLNLLY